MIEPAVFLQELYMKGSGNIYAAHIGTGQKRRRKKFNFISWPFNWANNLDQPFSLLSHSVFQPVKSHYY